MEGEFPVVFLFAVILGVLILLFIRELWCWYWKINKAILLLTEIRDAVQGKAVTACQSIGRLSPQTQLRVKEREELLVEGLEVQRRYAASSDPQEREQLKKRYKEIDSELEQQKQEPRG